MGWGSIFGLPPRHTAEGGRAAQGGGVRGSCRRAPGARVVVGVEAEGVAYSISTLWRPLVGSFLGAVIVSTPSSKVASMSPGTMVTPSGIERW